MFDARWGDDPRDADPREDERRKDRNRSREDDAEPAHGPRGAGAHGRDRDEDHVREEHRSRSRDDDDTRSLGRGGGGGNDRQGADEPSRGARDDARWPERDREARERPRDPHDVFTCHVDLPRGQERERVRDRDRIYTLRGSESRTLANDPLNLLNVHDALQLQR